MYRMKNSGLRMDPCGTPKITSDLDVKELSMTTCWEQ